MKLNKIALTFASVAMIGGLASCNTDDLQDFISINNGINQPLSVGTLADAPYLKDARAWKVYSSEMPDLQRIELTSSGNYLLIDGIDVLHFQTRSDAPSANPFKRVKKEETRSLDGLPLGVYKKVSDSEYILENYGTLTVNSDTELTLTLNSGKSIVFEAEALEAYSESTTTNRFCRTWELKAVERGYYYWDDSKDDYVLRTKRNLTQLEMEEDFIRYVVPTQFGTFNRYDWDKAWEDSGLWRWQNEKDQIFEYVFYDEFYQDYEYEVVYFYNDFAMFLEGDELIDENGEWCQTLDVLKAQSVSF